MDNEIISALINGIFGILGIIIGFCLMRLRYKTEKLKMEKLKLEIEGLEKKNQLLSLGIISNRIIPNKFNQYLKDLSYELNTWKGILGINKRIELNDIYVNMNFKSKDDKKEIQDLNLLDNILHDDIKYNRVLIIGHPGSGKSTLLRKWAYKITQDNLESENKNDYIAFYIPLNIFGGQNSICLNSISSVINLSLNNLYGFNTPIPEKLSKILNENVLKGKAIIFLDALDEVPDDKRQIIEEWINSFLINKTSNKIIITSRPGNYYDKIKEITKFDLSDFKEEQIESFISKWFELSQLNKVDIIKYIKTSGRLLTKNPLFLTMLCIIFENKNKKTIPSEGALFEEYIHELLKYRPEEKKMKLNYSLIYKIELLQNLACFLFEKGNESIPENILFQEVEKVFVDKNKIEENYKINFLLEIINTSGLINFKTTGHYCFINSIFIDFFVAKKVISDISIGLIDKEEYLATHSFTQKYEKIIPFINELLALQQEGI